eukprot:CAMPEP_0114566660 /NCGR_PEP_ID=MMETSP0114-20121206/15021_1 /TAXON_ID=31324 /ORGANISM="Goniomonas sp, Strain m" /LENGTH=232 /DNA_ID=CAMNT_0001753107 /DNA_START=62 /DNA_END=756 /DNA_ORIENTATION=-
MACAVPSAMRDLGRVVLVLCGQDNTLPTEWSHTAIVGLLFVDNIPKDLEADEFRKIFDPFGKISFCALLTMKDGVSRGRGIVAFSTWEEADAAALAANGTPMSNGKRLVVRRGDSGRGRRGLESCGVFPLDIVLERREAAMAISRAENEKIKADLDKFDFEARNQIRAAQHLAHLRKSLGPEPNKRCEGCYLHHDQCICHMARPPVVLRHRVIIALHSKEVGRCSNTGLLIA